MRKKSTQLSLFDSPHADRGWIAFLNETLQLPQERPYLAIDLFAGCGGLSLGFECAGVKTIGYSDLAKRAVDPAIKAASLAMLARAGGVI